MTAASDRPSEAIMKAYDAWVRSSFYAMRDDLDYRAHTPDGPLPGHITAAHEASNLDGVRAINKQSET